MQFRGLIAAVAVLAILGGVLYWSQHHKPAPAGSAEPSVVDVKAADVASLTLKPRGAQAVTLVQSAPGQWHITAPADYAADNSAANNLVSALAPLHAQRVVEDDGANLAQFGLSDPALEVDVARKSGGATRLFFGDTTPTGDGVYAMAGDDQHVYTVATSVDSSFDRKLPELRDRRLIPVDASAVNTLELNHGSQTVSFSREPRGWQMEKPQPFRTDMFQVDDLLQQVVGAQWQTTDNSDEDAQAWAHAAPYATVTLTGSFGSDTLEARNGGSGSYYAKSSAVQGIWKIQPALVSALGRGADDFRNKQLLDVDYTEPSAINYHAGTTDLDLTHSGNDWYADGKKMDADSVESLVSALRDLAASKFVTSGFANPGIDLNVAIPGKPVEKVQFARTAGGAIAKRADGPSLYFLDSATMNQLDEAVAGVKAAAAAKK